MEIIFKLGTSADAGFYPSLQISSQVTFISIVFSCLHCCHTSLKRLFSLVPTELLMLIKEIYITPKKHGSHKLGRIVFSTKGNWLYLSSSWPCGVIFSIR